MEEGVSRNRYILIVLIGLVGGLVGGIVSTQLISKYWHSKQIKAASFVVVDQQGRERGFFKTTSDGLPVLELDDMYGNTAVFVSVDENGSGGISFWADNGNWISLDLGLFDDGYPYMILSNYGAEKGALVLRLQEDGHPSLQFFNKSILRRLALCTDKDRPFISLFDRGEEPIWTAPLTVSADQKK
jgi:hypothetical protein